MNDTLTIDDGETGQSPAGAGDGDGDGDGAGSDATDVRIEEESIGYDQLFEILKNRRRREVVQYVTDAGEEVTLSRLAEELAATETGKDVAQITSQERKRVYVGLYQCHLPKMDDYGAIEYNKPRGRIESGEHTHRFERYLSVEDDDTESRWTRRHSTLTLVVALLLIGPLLVGAAAPSAALQVGVALLVGAAFGGALLYVAD